MLPSSEDEISESVSLPSSSSDDAPLPKPIAISSSSLPPKEIERVPAPSETLTFFDSSEFDTTTQGFPQIIAIPPSKAQIIGKHKFVHRKVPPLPPNFNGANDFTLFVDNDSNSWVWSIPERSTVKIAEYAQAIDIPANYYDLDFVFVAISQEYLSSLGFGVAFNEGTFLNAFDGFFTAQGLTLTYNGFSAFLDWENADSDVRVVSTPVVRVETSQQFNYSTVERIPYTTTSINDGVTVSNTEFVSAGFSLSGSVIDIGYKLRLELTQRNGAPVQSTSSDVPTIDEQTLTTSSELILNTWTLLGGSRTSRYSKTKGLLRKRESQSDDILYVFVRPRDQVKAIPRAIEVDPHQITNFGHVQGADFMNGDSLLPSPPAELFQEVSLQK